MCPVASYVLRYGRVRIGEDGDGALALEQRETNLCRCAMTVLAQDHIQVGVSEPAPFEVGLVEFTVANQYPHRRVNHSAYPRNEA